ncbi:MAG TPA: SpoIID/LytB domain-containing protein [Actinomycetota bacterium]|nr:SpoIID/LytB domain-containing protein [Actinomycetota bacterium]
MKPTGGSTRIVRALVPALAVVVTLAAAVPSARAAGEGSTTPGVTDDPFTGSPAPATPGVGRATGFRFFGSGFGHGVGMSQWGANGLAAMGWSHKRILKHFYRSTRVGRVSDPVKKIRVGLTWDRRSVHLGARGGPVKLWIGGPGGTRVGRIPGGRTWTVRAKSKGFAIRDHGGQLIGGRTWGGTGADLIATYGSTARAVVSEAGNGYSYGRGHLELGLYARGGSWNLRVVLPIGFEQYLYGLGEMPSSWPSAALRAQAVAGRTFATYKVKRYAPNAQCGCDISDGANDQVYVGSAKETGLDGRRWVEAVDDTRGQVVTHGGKVIQAFYAASDGGHSDAVEDVWHGGNDAFAVPYLKAECDPGEARGGNPWVHWQKAVSAAELTNRLAPYTGAIGRVRGFTGVRRGRGGRIVTATVRGGSGSASITGSELRWAIGAWDGRIWIQKDRNITGPIRDRYDAVMCRPGLPTSKIARVPGGSRQRFEKGAIFRNGGERVTVWLRGATYREYRAVKGPDGSLGMPTGQIVHSGPGTRALFDRGRILSKPGTGAHALWGRVLKEYLHRGGADGRLGFPTSRVHADGSGGMLADFEHGTIVCPHGRRCGLG